MKLLNDARHLLHRAGIDVTRWPHRPDDGVIDWALSAVFQSQSVNCVIDVGGNRGLFAERVRKLGYRGRIVSFEPSPTTLPVITAAAEHDPDWIVRPVGLSSKPGQAVLRLHENPELDSMLDAVPGVIDQIPTMHETGSASITLSTLEAEYPEIVAGITQPRVLLKSDTQGHEAEVLRGAGDKGLDEDVVAVLVELAAQPIYVGQPGMISVMDMIMTDGFTPVAFEPWFRSSDDLRAVEMDALFMRSADGRPDWGKPDGAIARAAAISAK